MESKQTQKMLFEEAQANDLASKGQLSKYLEGLIHTYRYTFKLKDHNEIGVKYVSDTSAGHTEFVRKVVADDNVERLAREYCSSVDVSRICILETLKNSDLYKKEEEVKNEEV